MSSVTASTPASSTPRISLDGGRPSLLHAATMRTGSAVVVCAAGEVDASNEDAWAQLLAEMAASTRPPHPFVVDVRNLDFMGCCAFAALAREAKSCQDRGVRLCLVSLQPIVERTLQACGLRWVLPIYATVEAAVAGTRAADGVLVHR